MGELAGLPLPVSAETAFRLVFLLEEKKADEIVDAPSDEDDDKRDIIVTPRGQPAQHQRQESELYHQIDGACKKETSCVLYVRARAEGVPVGEEIVGNHLHDIPETERHIIQGGSFLRMSHEIQGSHEEPCLHEHTRSANEQKSYGTTDFLRKI